MYCVTPPTTKADIHRKRTFMYVETHVMCYPSYNKGWHPRNMRHFSSNRPAFFFHERR